MIVQKISLPLFLCLLACVLDYVPTYAKSDIFYDAENATIWEFKNVHKKLKLHSPTVAYRSEDGLMTFDHLKGLMWDEEGRVTPIDAELAIYNPYEQVLEVKGRFNIQDPDGGVLTSHQAMIQRKNAMLELPNPLTLSIPKQSPNDSGLNVNAGKGKLLFKDKLFYLENDVEVHLHNQSDLSIRASMSSIDKNRGIAQFNHHARLQAKNYQARADQIRLFFNPGSSNQIQIKTIYLEQDTWIRFSESVWQEFYTLEANQVFCELDSEQTLKMLKAEGDVRVQLPDGTAFADNFIYDIDKEKMVFHGVPAKVEMSGKSIIGETIEYHARSKTMVVQKARILLDSNEL